MCQLRDCMVEAYLRILYCGSAPMKLNILPILWILIRISNEIVLATLIASVIMFIEFHNQVLLPSTIYALGEN